MELDSPRQTCRVNALAVLIHEVRQPKTVSVDLEGSQEEGHPTGKVGDT